ncbi:MAG: hypothetical protein ABW074_10430, partial [Sedimenticola sp.]
MSNARDNIISRLRRKRPEFPPGDISHYRENNSETTLQSRIEAFTEKLESVRAEVHRVNEQTWCAKLQSLCNEKGLENLLYGKNGPLSDSLESAWGADGTPILVSLDERIESWKEPIFNDIHASVTSVRAGIANVG